MSGSGAETNQLVYADKAQTRAPGARFWLKNPLKNRSKRSRFLTDFDEFIAEIELIPAGRSLRGKTRMRISDIRIGDRSRKDLGDISSLARSIETVGLLHPIVVSKDGKLIAGARRIAAFTMLGRDEIPHTVADSLQDAIASLRAERDENTERKDFLPSEAVMLAAQLEPFEREAARERQAKAGPREGPGAKKSGSENFSTPLGRASDKVAAAVGLTRPTLAKAKAVIEAARKDPERYGPVAEQMDKTGNVHGAYKTLAGRGGIQAQKIILTKDQKVEKIREMAATGAIAEQIAAEIEISEKRTRLLARKAGIQLADTVIGKHRRLDVNRMIEQTVISAESWTIGSELINARLDEVDISRIDGWISRLRSATSAVNGLIKKLERTVSNAKQ